MKLNWKDLIERVGWTAIQASAGAVLDLLISGEVTARAIGYAVAVATLKVVVAQKTSDNGLGDALPGGVEEGK